MKRILSLLTFLLILISCSDSSVNYTDHEVLEPDTTVTICKDWVVGGVAYKWEISNWPSQYKPLESFCDIADGGRFVTISTDSVYIAMNENTEEETGRMQFSNVTDSCCAITTADTTVTFKFLTFTADELELMAKTYCDSINIYLYRKK